MTDISELVKRLRLQPARYEHDVFWSDGAPLDAADVLEAQVKRIAELEKREKHLEEMFEGWRDEAIKASARIAELAAENIVLREALNGWQKWWELPWRDRRPDVADLRYRAARAALNGERNDGD